MVEEALVTFPRQAGWLLLPRLDEMLEITGAFWQYVESAQAWRLFLITPLVDTGGPGEVYRKIRSVLQEMPETERDGIELTDISLVSPLSNMAKTMRQFHGAIMESRGQRVRRTSVSQDETFIYRL